jgi:hypothetical protein
LETASPRKEALNKRTNGRYSRNTKQYCAAPDVLPA